MRLAIIVTVAIALTSGPTHGDEFPVKYMGGKPDLKKKTDGVLAVEQIEMYFKDRRAQRLFAFAADGTQASVVTREKKSVGCMIGVSVFPLTAVLMIMGMFDPEAACKRTHYFVEVKTNQPQGTETITFRSSKEQASRVAETINLWAAKTRPTSPERESREASSRRITG